MTGAFASAQAGTRVGGQSGAPDRTDPVLVDARHERMLSGEPVGARKADSDTLYLLGGPGRLDGKFQLANGTTPDWQGWAPVDRTLKLEADVHWNVSAWNGRVTLDPNFNPNHTMFCGELLAPCGAGDPPEGYRNGYDEWLDWYGTVADNTVATNVNVTGVLNCDAEPGEDPLYFAVSRATGQDEQVLSWGYDQALPMDMTFSLAPADYVGPGHDQIHLRFRATSDSGWSDEDCLWPTYGHTNLDNVRVTTDNGVNTYDDFEGGTPNWVASYPPACGNFGKLWPRLADLDHCNANSSPCVAWIDDGTVVPGTGGSPGMTWTYGPGGYVINKRGGLAGPGYHVSSEVWSPVLAWPGGASGPYAGCQLNFGVYRHLPKTLGVYYVWHVRASTDGGLSWSRWKDRNYVYDGADGAWFDVQNVVTDLLPSDRTHVQVAVGAVDYGWTWGYQTDDVTPAPYFDDVRVLAYSFAGPTITANAIDLFQGGNFPAIGVIDRANLGRNSVRLDMARNISARAHRRLDPGDSVVAKVAVARSGATIEGVPKLHYKLKPNPLFDPWRTSGMPNEGVRDGSKVLNQYGVIVPNMWRWDLPDSNFFFPGDVLHYYLEGQDNLGGDIGTTRLPPDTTGFSVFPGQAGYVPLRYPGAFVARALPTMFSAGALDQPHVLFWNDLGDGGGEEEWIGALTHLGYREGTDYDVYYTNAPSAGVGNGLGGRASASQLAAYDIMLYTSGDLGSYTLANGDFQYGDPGNDVAVMTAWLAQGGKKWFCTGDDLADDLGNSGAAALAFRNTFLPMTFDATDVRPLIDNQLNPAVDPVPGNAVGLTPSCIAYGGCSALNRFDAVRATGTSSVAIASFRDLSGAPYPYAAALYVPLAGGYTDRVIFMPYDFMYIATPPNGGKSPAPLETRAVVLGQILTFFGASGLVPSGMDETPAAVFSARSFPNPFNPSTKIEYSLPRDGRLSIKVYNVRGELVRTLLDAPMKATPKAAVTWTGDDDRGRQVASGVYFCQVKSADGEILNKVTLVK